MALDNYLSNKPDEPNVSGGCTAEARASISILDQSKRIPPTGHGTGRGIESGYKVAALAMSPKIYT